RKQEGAIVLLTLETAGPDASKISYLLHKHPDKVQSFTMSFGKVHVYYPKYQHDSAVACMLLDVDPVGMVRGAYRESDFMLGQYVNDRPFVASSFMSVAIAQVYSSALSGKCKDEPSLPQTPFPWTARIDSLATRGDSQWVEKVFSPLGYQVTTHSQLLDPEFPQWGESPYIQTVLSKTCLLSELLTHLYVLIPAFDNNKHYFVGEEELTKLLEKGEGWLAAHPHKEWIARRYLRGRANLVRTALSRLVDEETQADIEENPNPEEPAAEAVIRLHDQRHSSVVEELIACGAQSVLDLGCGEGKLVRELIRKPQFQRILGMDVSYKSLEIARKRLRYDTWGEEQQRRVELIHGSLIYSDKRLKGFDAAAVVEVIEHLEPTRLESLAKVLFMQARPKHVILTTPNKEYNSVWGSLPAGQFRHHDHRFEWTRAEFQAWCNHVATQYGYKVEFKGVGQVDPDRGTPTQMGVFHRD
ncbi:MAG: 3' terminal RNA ribose 2'-O-methyltransferase Hen1, partial [Planctomycetota bacterium]